MAEPQHDFGVLDEIQPEAIGVPGQRRFRMLLRRGNRTASLWMEKEQLAALAQAVDELLGQMPEAGLGRSESLATNYFPQPYEVETQVGRLSLGYDESAQLFVLLVYSLEAEENDDEIVRSRLTRGQFERFSQEAMSVVMAGRPRCPRCQQVLGITPHPCVNGYHRETE